jgi:hypothetical protein
VINAMTQRTTRLISIATAVVVIAAMAPVLFNFSSLYARIYDDRRFPALSRYALEPTPDIALVGSSMTFRIYEGYFKTRLRNISISGGSPLTGLAILASYPSLPRVVLVETNILSRHVESDLVEKFGKNDAASSQWFKPYRAAVSWIYYWIKFRPENVAELISSAPVTHDISVPLDRAADEFASSSTDEAMAENTQTMKRLVSTLESRGCKVYFYELPYPGNLNSSHFAATARTLIHDAFPDPKRWPKLDYHLPELRWVDAAHMDERSAAIVAREMDRVLGTDSGYVMVGANLIA